MNNSNINYCVTNCSNQKCIKKIEEHNNNRLIPIKINNSKLEKGRILYLTTFLHKTNFEEIWFNSEFLAPEYSNLIQDYIKKLHKIEFISYINE